jgi:ABC-type Na+ efflux pump permease subunit
MKLKHILRIARWEIQHQTGSVDRNTAALTVILIGISVVLAVGGGLSLQSAQGEIYTVGVNEESEFNKAIRRSDSISIQEPSSSLLESGRQDIAIGDRGNIVYIEKDSQTRAAIAESQDAVEKYNTRELIKSNNEVAAYPVDVDVIYIEQSQQSINTVTNITGDQTDTNSTSDDGDSGGLNTDEQPSTNDSVTQQETQDETIIQEAESSSVDTPDSISPPFPFKSVLLGFVFIIPLNFVVQNFTSSIMDERLDYSGELLLAAPISSYDIVIGKMLPYFTLLAVITSVISVVLGGSVLSVIAVMSLALTFMALGFLAGIFSRSYKELTFVFLTFSICIVSFALIPAIFSSVHPIAIISPLTLVVSELNGEQLPLVEIAFSIGPILITGIILIVAGVGIYRQEDLFTQRSVPNKFIDLISKQVGSARSLFKIDIAVIPFVFVAELLLISILFIAPEEIAQYILLICIAVIEEIAKSIGVFAAVTKGKLDTTRKRIKAGILGGIGFFAAEKLFVIAQTVGLLGVDLGNASFGPVVTNIIGSPFAYAIPVFWIGLHPVTTAISSYAAGLGKYRYAVGVLLASLIHFLYNMVIIYVI